MRVTKTHGLALLLAFILICSMDVPASSQQITVYTGRTGSAAIKEVENFSTYHKFKNTHQVNLILNKISTSDSTLFMQLSGLGKGPVGTGVDTPVIVIANKSGMTTLTPRREAILLVDASYRINLMGRVRKGPLTGPTQTLVSAYQGSWALWAYHPFIIQDLSHAHTVEGKIDGTVFKLTPDQIAAIRAFYESQKIAYLHIRPLALDQLSMGEYEALIPEQDKVSTMSTYDIGSSMRQEVYALKHYFKSAAYRSTNFTYLHYSFYFHPPAEFTSESLNHRGTLQTKTQGHSYYLAPEGFWMFGCVESCRSSYSLTEREGKPGADKSHDYGEFWSAAQLAYVGSQTPYSNAEYFRHAARINYMGCLLAYRWAYRGDESGMYVYGHTHIDESLGLTY